MADHRAAANDPVGPDEWRHTCLVNAIVFGLFALCFVLACVFR